MKKVFKLLVLTVALLMLVSALNFVNATDVEFNVVSNTNVSDLVSSNPTNEATDSSVMPIDETLDSTTMPIDETVQDSDVMPINEESVENITLDDVYQWGENVSITQDVSGNVYIMSEKVNIENVTIEGNVFLMAEKVSIKNSYISGSAFIMGDEIELDSLIQDLYLLGNEINLGNSSYISRTARIGGESVTISGIIDRDCYIDAENITVLDGTEIAGTLDYSTGKEASIGENTSIANVNANIIERVEEKPKTLKIDFTVYDFLSALLKVFVIGGILILLLNKKIQNVEKINFVEVIKSLAIGSVIFFAVPVLSLIFMVSIIGFGLGALLVLVYIVLLIISTVTASLMIAKAFVKEPSKLKLLGITVLVYMIYKLLCIIPVLGALLVIIMGLTGLGYVPRIIWAKEKKEEVVEIVEKVEE